MPTTAAAAAAAATSTASASGSSGFSGSVSSTSSSSSCSVGGVSSSSCFMHHNSFNPIDTADPNWQATKSSVRERNAAMFNNDLMADISFIVGSDGEWCNAPQWLSDFFNFNHFFFPLTDNIQTIPAHKYVLATGSSVFYAMFFGGLADNKLEIKVPDVEPMAFLTLLKYVVVETATRKIFIRFFVVADICTVTKFCWRRTMCWPHFMWPKSISCHIWPVLVSPIWKQV